MRQEGGLGAALPPSQYNRGSGRRKQRQAHEADVSRQQGYSGLCLSLAKEQRMTVTVGHRVREPGAAPPPRPGRTLSNAWRTLGGPGEITFRGQSGGYKQLRLGDKQVP